MAEQDDGDKTEEPSEKKIREAKEKGQFAKSKEFSPLSVLAVGYSGFLVLSPSWGSAHTVFSTNTYRWTAAVEEDYRSALLQMCANAMQHLWDIMGVPFIVFWIFVVALNMAHNRFIIPKEALKFDIKKIDPISNAKEKFFSLNPIVELFKSLLKLFLLGYIVWKVVGSQWTTFPTLLWSTPAQALLLLHETVWDIFWGCMPMIIVIAIFDFGYQWYDNRKKLMMSRQEIKDEITYYLPDNLLGIIWKGKYKGQTQKWYIMRFLGEDNEINLKTKNPEFLEWKWVNHKNITDKVVEFKLHVYEKIKNELNKLI